MLGFVLFALGEYTTARAHLEQVIAFYDPRAAPSLLVSLRGSDAGLSALAYDACCLWCLGYPDQAAKRSQEALALARELDHPFSLADVLAYAGCLFNEMRRDAQPFRDSAEELKRLATEKRSRVVGIGNLVLGRSTGHAGTGGGGDRANARGPGASGRGAAERCYRSGCLCSLAEAQAKAGHPEEGLSTLAEALALVEETDERYWEAELYRLQGRAAAGAGR